MGGPLSCGPKHQCLKGWWVGVDGVCWYLGLLMIHHLLAIVVVTVDKKHVFVKFATDGSMYCWLGRHLSEHIEMEHHTMGS